MSGFLNQSGIIVYYRSRSNKSSGVTLMPENAREAWSRTHDATGPFLDPGSIVIYFSINESEADLRLFHPEGTRS